MAWRLAVRDISAQYRQAALGLLWAFALPVANALIWLFANASGVVLIRDTEMPYPIYVFTGTMLWAIFLEAANAPLQLTTAAKPMLAKINFPREAIIVSGIYQTLFNAAIKVVVLLPALLFLGVQPSGYLFLLPVAVMTLVFAGTAVGLFLTPVGLLYTDIGKTFPLAMQFMMYLTPVVFPIPAQGIAATIFRINPVTPLIQTARAWLTGSLGTDLVAFGLVNLGTVLVLFLMWVIYRAAMPILIEKMSAS